MFKQDDHFGYKNCYQYGSRIKISETLHTVEPRLTTTPFIRPSRYYGHIFSNQTKQPLSHFIILKTPLMRPPRYYDQDFMAQRWSH